MRFHDVRFPTKLSFGSVGGPERRTEIVTLANGYEERNTPWRHSLRRYDAGVGMRSLDDIQDLIAFFEARRGQLFGFRWKDWADYKSCAPSKEISATDQQLGIGDGVRTEFQLVKRYESGSETYERPVSKPVASSVLVAIDGALLAIGPDFSLNPATGQVTFAEAPGEGQRVTSGFEYDVPVRFDTDVIMTSLEAFRAGEAPSVPVVEVRV